MGAVVVSARPAALATALAGEWCAAAPLTTGSLLIVNGKLAWVVPGCGNGDRRDNICPARRKIPPDPARRGEERVRRGGDRMRLEDEKDECVPANPPPCLTILLAMPGDMTGDATASMPVSAAETAASRLES